MDFGLWTVPMKIDRFWDMKAENSQQSTGVSRQSKLSTFGFGPWPLDHRLWTIALGLRTLDPELWTLDLELWTLDPGLWTMDFGP